jgi:hypothetical protein
MKANELLIVIDTVAATFWGLLGAASLVGVVVAGAWWQLFTVAMCSVMVWVNVREIRRIGR